MGVSGAQLKVLSVLIRDAASEKYGLEIVRTTGLKSGTVYPLLDRLEVQGLLKSRWEEADPADLGRPRRRLYKLTGTGAHDAHQLLAEFGVNTGLAW